MAHSSCHTCLCFLSPFGLMTLVISHRHRDSSLAIPCICMDAHPRIIPHLTRWACAHLVLVSLRLIEDVKMKSNPKKIQSSSSFDLGYGPDRGLVICVNGDLTSVTVSLIPELVPSDTSSYLQGCDTSVFRQHVYIHMPSSLANLATNKSNK